MCYALCLTPKASTVETLFDILCPRSCISYDRLNHDRASQSTTFGYSTLRSAKYIKKELLAETRYYDLKLSVHRHHQSSHHVPVRTNSNSLLPAYTRASSTTVISGPKHRPFSNSIKKGDRGVRRWRIERSRKERSKALRSVRRGNTWDERVGGCR